MNKAAGELPGSAAQNNSPGLPYRLHDPVSCLGIPPTQQQHQHTDPPPAPAAATAPPTQQQHQHADPPPAPASAAATAPLEPLYYDSNGELHFRALESTHKTLLASGASHIWACCRCTSRNVNDFRKCGGGGCRHWRCERDCRWLVLKGPVVAVVREQNAIGKGPPTVGASSPSSSSSPKRVGGKGRGVGGVGGVGGQLPTPPSEVGDGE